MMAADPHHAPQRITQMCQVYETIQKYASADQRYDDIAGGGYFAGVCLFLYEFVM